MFSNYTTAVQIGLLRHFGEWLPLVLLHSTTTVCLCPPALASYFKKKRQNFTCLYLQGLGSSYLRKAQQVWPFGFHPEEEALHFLLPHISSAALLAFVDSSPRWGERQHKPMPYTQPADTSGIKCNIICISRETKQSKKKKNKKQKRVKTWKSQRNKKRSPFIPSSRFARAGGSTAEETERVKKWTATSDALPPTLPSFSRRHFRSAPQPLWALRTSALLWIGCHSSSFFVQLSN